MTEIATALQILCVFDRSRLPTCFQLSILLHKQNIKKGILEPYATVRVGESEPVRIASQLSLPTQKLGWRAAPGDLRGLWSLERNTGERTIVLSSGDPPRTYLPPTMSAASSFSCSPAADNTC